MPDLYARTYRDMNTAPRSIPEGLLLSSDSHVMEPPDLWKTRVPAQMRDAAPEFPAHQEGVGFQQHPGGQDPQARVQEMTTDGVAGEVLYPTLGLNLFSIEDAALQEACFRAYNDWLIDYCRHAPERLIGVPMISVYNIDAAVAELRRCSNAGLHGALIWQVPPTDLPFGSEHYEPFWSAAEELHAPVSLHILTGFGYSSRRRPEGNPRVEAIWSSVNLKQMEASRAIFDLIFAGVLERHPRLQVVLVENEIGWLPFVLEQWDYYYTRMGQNLGVTLAKKPSDYFHAQVFATFFNDAVGGHTLAWWGDSNCMWSNDFPHANSTWPRSRETVGRDLGHLPEPTLQRLVRDNMERLYNIKVPQLVH